MKLNKGEFEIRNHLYICLSIYDWNENQVYLSIQDNGLGISANIDIESSKTLGLKLVQMLAEQLEANYELNKANHGTLFSMSFESRNPRGYRKFHVLTT